MKKISLILAFILCLVPVLSGCGANSSAKNAAKAAAAARYVDQDTAAFFEVAVDYNVDILKDYLDSDDAEAMRTKVRENQDRVKESIKKQWDHITESEKEGGLGGDDLKVKVGNVIYCNEYEAGSEAFDNAMKGFIYDNTDVEDYVEKVAKVGVLLTVTYTVDGQKFTEAGVQNYTCYCIDGNWYVD